MPAKRRVPTQGVPFRRTFLREWRNAKKMSAESVGNVIGVSHATITRMETGKQAVTQDDLVQLAEVYGCTPEDLLARKPSDEEFAGNETKAAVHIPEDFLRIWQDADPLDREKIVDMARIITGQPPK